MVLSKPALEFEVCGFGLFLALELRLLLFMRVAFGINPAREVSGRRYCGRLAARDGRVSKTIVQHIHICGNESA